MMTVAHSGTVDTAVAIDRCPIVASRGNKAPGGVGIDNSFRRFPNEHAAKNWSIQLAGI
eukprot:COSAG01_NODE_22192_length_867_cov_1.777344_3_plen_58_part_01